MGSGRHQRRTSLRSPSSRLHDSQTNTVIDERSTKYITFFFIQVVYDEFGNVDLDDVISYIYISHEAGLTYY